MAKQKKEMFVAEACTCCGQTKNYDLSLSRGHALIVLALYNAVRRLGKNRVNAVKDMQRDPKEFRNYRDMVAGGFISPQMRSNISQVRYHGLIAFADGGGDAEYLITPKGVKFLRNEPVQKTAIIDKATGHNAGYFSPDGFTRFSELLKKETPFWSIPTYDSMFDESTPRTIALAV